MMMRKTVERYHNGVRRDKKNRRDKKIKGMFDEKVLNLYSRFSHVCFLNY